MFVASVTRLRLRSPRYLPAFLPDNARVVRQLRATPGFRGGELLVTGWLTYWTASVWENETAMRAFRNSGAHRAAMQKLPEWCDEAALTHWPQATTASPDWREAYRRMGRHARFPRVRGPSVDHLAGRLRPPRATWLARPLRPLSMPRR